MSDELECPVCQELCTNPRDCLTCGRVFCSGCIAQLKSCPLCRKQPFESRENIFASRLLNSVRLKCPQCDSLVDRPRLEDHKRTCPARPRRCSFKGCEFVATNKMEALDHMNTKHSDEIWTNMDNLSTIITPE